MIKREPVFITLKKNKCSIIRVYAIKMTKIVEQQAAVLFSKDFQAKTCENLASGLAFLRSGSYN